MAQLFLSHLDWSGAVNGATCNQTTLNRDLDVHVDGVSVPMSAPPDFGGNASRVNPEQLYVASLSACQALTYLSLAARGHVPVTHYSDDAIGELALVDGRLRMAGVKLRPRITLAAGGSAAQALELVQRAHRQCFIGNSVSAQVDIEPVIQFAANGEPNESSISH